jgi:hypothetical protein
MHKTHKNLHIIVVCASILNHQKSFKITKKIIITHSHNISNLIHTLIYSK